MSHCHPFNYKSISHNGLWKGRFGDGVGGFPSCKEDGTPCRNTWQHFVSPRIASHCIIVKDLSLRCSWKVEHVAREEKSVGGAAYISTIIFSPLIVVKISHNGMCKGRFGDGVGGCPSCKEDGTPCRNTWQHCFRSTPEVYRRDFSRRDL
ncbi:hypothetical protein F2Q68_00007551 [Brassica cretica]|uniref:Uncharacterized protein n=1 Tax=Brassica cretica TaxID=69181 RepID=A0A8S9KT21_BRACR|nr:hypothetical protein F2Q68_00007551 [Brassica cretica]